MKREISKKIIYPWTMVAVLGVSAVTRHAQEASTPIVLDEIVVTAQKREQSMQDVPIAISALSGATLRDTGALGMQAGAQLVPSLSFVQADGALEQSYRVRGIGSDSNIPTFEPDVGLFIDGVYMPRSGLGIDDLVDVARIEVLKGPQSTLYGKNVTAGVVNIVTEAPSRNPEVHISANLSMFDGGRDALAERLAGCYPGPLSESVRVRLTGVWYNRGQTEQKSDG